MKPFLKWVGGKQQLLPELISRLPENFNNYHEPFLGGGALFFALADNILKDKKCFLNDYNSELINCYKEIKEYPKGIIDRFQEEFIDDSCTWDPEEFYYNTRNVDRNSEEYINYSSQWKALRFLYLNKSSFNGLWRENSKGQMNAPWNKKKCSDIKWDWVAWARASVLLQEAILTSCSYQDALDVDVYKDDFVYADPPYLPLSETSSFTAYKAGSFGLADQIDLAQCLTDLDKQGVKWMTSNSDHPTIHNLYQGFRIEKVQARRNINSKGDGRGHISELLIRNY